MRCRDRTLWLLVVFGCAWRAIIAWLTPVPSEDGVNYLWMAERFAEGSAGLALGEVFPPLLPLLTAGPVALGIESFRAAQMVLIVLGALAVVPIVRLVEHFAPDQGFFAGCFFAVAHLPVRFAAEIYTEPLFLLCGGMAMLAGLRGRWIVLGVASGLGFWLRAESVFLVIAFLVLRARRAWPAAVIFGLFVAVLGAWRASAGLGWDLLPKLAFNWDRGVGGGDGGWLAGIGANLVQLPWLWVEAFALVGVLALWGVVVRLRHGQPDGVAPLFIVLGLAFLLIAAFVPRRRFLVSWMFAVLPITMIGLRSLPARLFGIVVTAVVVSSAALSLRVTESDRMAERSVGQFLGGELRAGATVVGDMTRVLYFAGQRPLPPRRFSADDLVAAAGSKAVQFVVLGSRRPANDAVVRRLDLAYTRLAFPKELRTSAESRGIIVLVRR